MLNLCVFIFVIYAVSFSARAILFGNNRKRRAVAYSSASSQKRKKNNVRRKSVAVKKRKSTVRQHPKRRNNVVPLKSIKTKTGRPKNSGRPFLALGRKIVSI